MEGQSLQSTLRRGWYWGSQQYRETLLEKFGGKAGEKRNRDAQSNAMLKDHAVKQAEGIVAAANRHLGEEKEWMKSIRRDKRRVAMAWTICRQTNVPHRWIASRLRMRSAANVSQTVRNFEQVEEKQLSKEVREWITANFVD